MREVKTAVFLNLRASASNTEHQASDSGNYWNIGKAKATESNTISKVELPKFLLQK